MSERIEHTLLYIKYVDDALAEQGAKAAEGAVSGISLRILARSLPDGRTSVAASLYRRMHRMRASGKAFHYWAAERLTALSRTKQDLVVLRDLNHRTGKSISEHVFDEYVIESWIRDLSGTLQRWLAQNPLSRRLEGPEPEGVGLAVNAAIAAIAEHIGGLPDWSERFPLLDGMDFGRGRPGVTYLPYLDAHDHAQVAKNLFGVRAYRRPLSREVQRLDIDTLNWFALFRGLVPVDWIVDAMSAIGSGWQPGDSIASLQRRGIRAILRQTPQPVLRRILKEPVHQARRTLVDASGAVFHRLGVTRDLDLLPEMIAARGQRRIRGSRDLEHLIRGLPEIERWNDARARSTSRVMQQEIHSLYEMNQYNRQIGLLPEGTAQVAIWELWKDETFRQQALGLIEDRRRELMAARERERLEQQEARRRERIAKQAERHLWAIETAAVLDGVVIAPGLSLVVAKDAGTLARWGAVMNNCIGGYSSDLELDVFAAVCDAEGRTRLNLQVTQAHGIEQILGKNNRDAVHELGTTAQLVVDGLAALGIGFHPHALGMRELNLPQNAP